MHANEEVQEREDGDHIPPARLVTPGKYKLGAPSQSLLHSIIYSGLAWFALGLAQVISGLGCLVTPFVGLYGVFWGIVLEDIELILYSLLGTPVAFVFQFATFVLFARVAELERR
jgi:hypothetical protein